MRRRGVMMKVEVYPSMLFFFWAVLPVSFYSFVNRVLCVYVTHLDRTANLPI